jgi:DNA-binding response OmpR family regulator
MTRSGTKPTQHSADRHPRFCPKSENGKHLTAPILLILDSEQAPEPDVVLGSGANDSMIRPWDPAEMMITVAAAKQRASAEGQPRLESGPLVADLAARQVRPNGKLLRLTRTPFNALVCLMRVPGRPVTEGELARMSLKPSTATKQIRNYISRIRRELGEHGCRHLIQTARPHTYVLVTATG